MKRKFDPSTTDVPQVRHLPARRVPKGCMGTAARHQWLVGWNAIVRQLPQFEAMHNPIAGPWEWVACAGCEFAYQTHDRNVPGACWCGGTLPMASKRKYCDACKLDRQRSRMKKTRMVQSLMRALSYCSDCGTPTRTHQQVRCPACKKAQRRKTGLEWFSKNRETVNAARSERRRKGAAA